MRFTIAQEINIAQISIFTIIFQQIKLSQMLVFDERGKPEYPGKKVSEQSREVQCPTLYIFFLN